MHINFNLPVLNNTYFNIKLHCDYDTSHIRKGNPLEGAKFNLSVKSKKNAFKRKPDKGQPEQ